MLADFQNSLLAYSLYNLQYGNH